MNSIRSSTKSCHADDCILNTKRSLLPMRHLMYTYAILWSVSKLSTQTQISHNISFMLLSTIMLILTRLLECIIIFTQASGSGLPKQVIINLCCPQVLTVASQYRRSSRPRNAEPLSYPLSFHQTKLRSPCSETNPDIQST
jgi:hypothetical protein